MKQKLILTTLAICLLTVGGLTANAYQGQGGEHGSRAMAGPGSGEMEDCCQSRGSQQEMMAAILDLTEEQQEKIAAIHQEARTANETKRTEIQEYQGQIQELINAEGFDEDAVRALAEKKAAIQIDMVISRARIHNETLAIMTPEQQELAKKLHAMRQNKQEGKHQRGHGCKW